MNLTQTSTFLETLFLSVPRTFPCTTCTANIFREGTARRLKGHDPARGSNQEVFQRTRGSSRVGSGGVGNLTGRVRSGRVRRFSNITGQAGPP